jgi:KDO2-lipid IV(A) lauroyltransferase
VSQPLPKRLKRAARSLFLQGLIRLLALLPLGVALRLGSAVGRLGWPLAGETRRQMLASLAVAFPGKTPAEREAIGRRSFVHLAWLAAEVVTLPRHDRRLEDYVRFAPGAEELLREAIGRGRGLVFVTGHIGNWELMARRVARAGIPNAVIAKAGHDPRMNRTMARIRADGGVTTLWREDPATARAMIRVFKEGKALGLLIDQDTHVQGVFVPFFGRLAFTPRAAGDLAMRFRAPVVVAWCRRRGPRPGDGHEVLAVEVPYDADSPDREAEARRVTAAATARLEGAIRERPEEWVWMHERWKTRPPDEGTVPQASSVPKSRELTDV